MKFHFTQAVCGIREQQSPERAQGKGDGFQKLTCASTALDSKSEKALMALMQQLGQALAEYSGVAARPTGAAAGQESLETSGPNRRGQTHTSTAVLGEKRTDSAWAWLCPAS